jgi:excisionase family DNA binding protein
LATMKLIEMLEKRNEALKVSEVARILGVTPQHIYKMAAAGLIPCFHVKGAIRFWPSELAEWIRVELERAERERSSNGKGNVLKHGT